MLGQIAWVGIPESSPTGCVSLKEDKEVLQSPPL